MTTKLEDMTPAQLKRAFKRSRWLAIEAQRAGKPRKAADSLANAAALADELAARRERIPD